MFIYWAQRNFPIYVDIRSEAQSTKKHNQKRYITDNMRNGTGLWIFLIVDFKFFLTVYESFTQALVLNHGQCVFGDVCKADKECFFVISV